MIFVGITIFLKLYSLNVCRKHANLDIDNIANLGEENITHVHLGLQYSF